MAQPRRRYQFALVISEKRIHRWPGFETCNLDAAARSGHRQLQTAPFARKIPRLLTEGWELCAHCFPDGRVD